MNIVPCNNIPVIGKDDEPLMLTVQIVVTPLFKAKMERWQEKTGMHVTTIGNLILTLGHAALSKILDDENTREILIDACKPDPETYGSTED